MNNGRRIQPGALWRELKDWRKHWSTRKFFQGLFLGLVFTLLDTGTDFNFAWSVPSECPVDQTPGNFSFCGPLHPKQVELFTYVFISNPALWVGLTSIFNLLWEVISQCCGGQVHRVVKASAEAFAILIQVSFTSGVFFAAASYSYWAPAYPSMEQAFTYFVKTMAYLSAIGNIGVKLVGLFVHGPETRHLVFQATDIETRCGSFTYYLILT